MSLRKTSLISILLLAAAGAVLAQANLTGALRGVVTLEDGTAVPGVTVQAESEDLLGQRFTVTSAGGKWILRNLPPGDYTVTFELQGMDSVTTTGIVDLGRETQLVTAMGVAAAEGEIEVVARPPSPLSSPELSTSIDFEAVNSLPIEREPDDIAKLAPGLSGNTPNNNQVSISGGFAYDNVFLIDGVDTNDNLFGSTNPVYIEDAIADVQDLTS